jgi:hypothetical protein
LDDAMTIVNPPLFLQTETYSAANDRYGIRAGLALPPALNVGGNQWPDGGGVIPSDNGVVPADQPLEVIPNNGLTLTVRAGSAVIDAGNVGLPIPGCYIGRNNGSTTVTLAARDTQARVDLVYAGIKDSTNGDATNEFVIGVAKGIPNTSSAPTAVTGVSKFIPLATVNVAPSGAIDAAAIGDRRQWVTAVGGVQLSRADNYSPPALAGRLRYSMETGNLAFYDAHSGAPGWKPLHTRDDYLKDQKDEFERYKIVAFQHNERKRTGNTNWEVTPGVDLNSNDVWSQLDPSAITTANFQTPTGRAVVTLTGVLSNDTSTGEAWMGFSVRRASNNNELIAPANSNACLNAVTVANKATSTWTGVVSGLPVDTDCNARLQFKRGGTGNWAYFQYTNITVSPIR